MILPPDALPDIAELAGDLREVAEIVGVEKALILAHRFKGVPIRLTNLERFINRHRNECIRRDYDTGNYTYIQLARKYKLSEKQMSNILNAPDAKQQMLPF